MKKYLEVFNSPQQSFRAVAIGSSLTSQDWCHPNWIDWLNYTFRESKDWNNAWRKRVINSGRDGATIEHFLENFDSEIAFYEPHVVIYCVGMNSIHDGLDEFSFREHTLRLLEKIESISSDVLMWSPYAILSSRYQSDLKKISDIYKKIATENDCVYIDIYNEFLKYDLSKIFTFTNNENEYWGIKESEIDFLHCNELGNQIIADKIANEGFRLNLNDWEFGSMKLNDLSEYLR